MPHKGKSKRRKQAYSPGTFPTTQMGPRGLTVTAFERDRSGKASLRWEVGGQLRKRALGVNVYTTDGQINPDAQRRVNIEQKRVLDCLLAGKDPYPDSDGQSSEQRVEAAALTLDRGFKLYQGEKGPTGDFDEPRRKLYQRVHAEALRLFGPDKSIGTLKEADLQGYANTRRITIAQSKRASKGGARQAEIEVRCLLAVFEWLRTSYGAEEVKLTTARDLLKRLKNLYASDAPRFSDDEVGCIAPHLWTSDPRLALLLIVQAACRAGQVLKCKRSDLSVRTHRRGQSQFVLLVPGKGNKPPTRYFLPLSATQHLESVMAQGFLRDLEASYQESGEDYPLFPGSIGTLQPDAVIPRGRYKSWDRTVALNAFKEVEEKAGVKHVAKRGFHAFRRRAVDILMANGASVAQVQAAGGWRSSQIPMKIYWQGVADTDREQAADLLEAAAIFKRAAVPDGSHAEAEEHPEVTVSYPESYPDLAQTLTQKGLTDDEVGEVLELTQWAWVELNYRPHAYQRTRPAQSRRFYVVSLPIAPPAETPGSVGRVSPAPNGHRNEHPHAWWGERMIALAC